jgi:REP element-mobilizing transposase RayT
MPNTYTQLHHQFVFATKFRDASIHKSWREDLHKYITGIVQNHKHKMLQINSMPDHIHMLIGMRPHQSVSQLLQMVKEDSSKWIKQNRLCSRQFTWQDGYGAFSYSKSQVDNVILYIQHQQEHHRFKSFREEYISMLNEAGIEYDERYIFHEPI